MSDEPNERLERTYGNNPIPPPSTKVSQPNLTRGNNPIPPPPPKTEKK